MSRRKILRILSSFVASIFIIVGISISQYVRAHPNDPLQQNVASWARENNLGMIVDKMESLLHNDPPAVAPADSLALAIEPITDETDVPTPTTLPAKTPTATKAPASKPKPTKKPTSTTPATNSDKPLRVRPTVATASCPLPANSATTSTTTTSTTSTTTTTSTTIPDSEITTTTETPVTTTTLVLRPVDLDVQVSPSLSGEGQWKSIMRVRKTSLIYATSIRPLWCFGSVVATMATFNPSLVHAGLFNGTEMPGGKNWKNGKKVTQKALPSLLASFNGGFRFEHHPGGYFTEGKTVRPLSKGYATFAIAENGLSTVGVWGDNIRDDGTWKSLRQNLPPIVHKGKSVYANYPDVDWGQDYSNKVYSFRSAICTRTDGLMMFVAIGKVNIRMLADSLVILGCSTAMELDINGTWPNFSVYSGFGKTSRDGQVIDKRMGDPNRYLSQSTKDFIALFDPQTLPAGVVK